MTLRLTAEEKEDRDARARAKRFAAAKECGRYIVCCNQAQFDAAVTLINASDAFTPKLSTVLELTHGSFNIDGSVAFTISDLMTTGGAYVTFKHVKLDIDPTTHGTRIAHLSDDV